MTNAFQQYLKDTQNELHHVAWPTREQTIIYTILVIAISFGVSLYLGFADLVFTSGLSRAVGISSNSAPIVQTQAPIIDVATSSAPNTPAPTDTPAAPSSDGLTLPDQGNKQQQ